MWLDLCDHPRAEDCAHRAHEAASTIDQITTATSASIDLVLAAIEAGAIGLAEQRIAESERRVATMQGKTWHGWLFDLRLERARAGLALAKHDIDASLAHAAGAIARAERLGRIKYLAIGETTRGDALLAAGRRDDGIAALHRAHAHALAYGDPALALAVTRRLLAVAGDDALRAAARALAARIARELPDDARARFAADTTDGSSASG
jgi:hypothetical protein